MIYIDKSSTQTLLGLHDKPKSTFSYKIGKNSYRSNEIELAKAEKKKLIDEISGLDISSNDQLL